MIRVLHILSVPGGFNLSQGIILKIEEVLVFYYRHKKQILRDQCITWIIVGCT